MLIVKWNGKPYIGIYPLNKNRFNVKKLKREKFETVHTYQEGYAEIGWWSISLTILLNLRLKTHKFESIGIINGGG